MDLEENIRFYKHFHTFPSILEPPEPARGPPKASQITSRPGSVGMAFWLRMMGNVMFYKGFYDFEGSSWTLGLIKSWAPK